MTQIKKIIFYIILGILAVAGYAEQMPHELLYLYPKPDSRFISETANILVRLQSDAQAQLQTIQFQLCGDKSGILDAERLLSDDAQTLIIQPTQAFQSGETISVTLSTAAFKKFTFSFHVSPLTHLQRKQLYFDIDPVESLHKPQDIETVGRISNINGVTVPSDFPTINISEYNENNLAPGYIFTGLRQSYLMILKNDGTPYYYHKSNDFLMDFKVLHNGMLSRTVDDWSTGERFYVVMDKHFCGVDTFWVQNGYETDHHDFQLLPNGHVMMIAGDYQQIDMSKIVSGGKSNANVRGCHVQELDQNMNVVFQWDCWDEIPITDAKHENLLDRTIDYMHMNSIELDYDGNIIASCRNTSECIKINRQTGELMWVLGGVQNDFTFLNDSDQNTYQHMLRSVPNKPDHYTLFDNGNLHNPVYTRGVEFKLDTENWTAEKVWEHRHTPDYHTGWLGSVQRLPNGNTLMNWATGNTPFAYEISENGEVVYQANNPDGYACYRSYRFDWHGQAKKPYLLIENLGNRLALIFNLFGETKPDYYKIYAGNTLNEIAYLDTTSQTRYDFLDVEDNTRYYFKVTAVMPNGSESDFSNIEYSDVALQSSGENIIQNGDFSRGSKYWTFAKNSNVNARGFARNSEYVVDIDNGGNSIYDIQVLQTDVALFEGETYRFEFDAWAASNRAIEAKVAKEISPWTNYGAIGYSGLSTRLKHFSYEFVMQHQTDIHARIVINCGSHDADVYLDNISLTRLSSTTVEQPQPTKAFQLAPAYPNPFNSQTNITYSLDKDNFVTLRIYDLLGHHVRTLVESKQKQGEHLIQWDGKDEHGQTLASGIYFSQISVNNNRRTQKLTLVQ